MIRLRGKVSAGSPLVSVALLAVLSALGPGECEAQTTIRSWKVAGPYPADQVVRGSYPNFYGIFLAPWQEMESNPAGLVNLAPVIPREHPAGDVVIARHVFFSPEDRVINLNFAYADEVDVFFNGWRLFSGRQAGALVNPAATLAVGVSHQLPLHVKRGLNEVFLMAASESDAWGFGAETDIPLAPVPESSSTPVEVWATPDTFLTPESVIRDPERDVLYVSNFDNQFGSKPEPSGYLSRLSLTGEILDHRWVEGLRAPTGMDIWKDTLFVAERGHLLAVDLTSGAVAGRWAIPDPVFPNDLVIDDQGTVYISDTRTEDWDDSRIYRFRDGVFDVLANAGISRANGIWIHEGWLIVGSSGDGLLKRVDLASGRVETVVSLGAGIIDGIKVDREGNLLVSHWEGQLYRIFPDGRIERLLDALPEGWNTADFEYIPETDLLLIPTFLENRVRAIRIGG